MAMSAMLNNQMVNLYLYKLKIHLAMDQYLYIPFLGGYSHP